MRLIVFGATGRVGKEVINQALGQGHEITAFVRDPSNFSVPNVATLQGDVTDRAAVTSALGHEFDAVFVCIGAASLKPSTLVTDGFRSIVAGMEANGLSRIIGVSGTAEMENKTLGGKVYTAILRLTPIGHAARDHDGALAILKKSSLCWTLAACNYLANGAKRGHYCTSLVFGGGFKIIHPPDVADFLLKQLDDPRFTKRVVGIWY